MKWKSQKAMVGHVENFRPLSDKIDKKHFRQTSDLRQVMKSNVKEVKVRLNQTLPLSPKTRRRKLEPPSRSELMSIVQKVKATK
jgi:hypothetical protein